ncbi:TIGR04086 family membrane protein [Pantoea sp. Aalb]|uniref:TIGR04086 family membrane protein n=1 Tax=Pantoea sp. Aalb TaxID=2576762 RepID=UPI001329F764|nr:TIGR04086 family membrane protein [Pantoea sp. Aalb]MXP67252.1 hypothetical protein [Pantoea sp. Aalb]
MSETWINNPTGKIVYEGEEVLLMKRISWSAIFAGVITTLTIHILLGLLGIAIGTTTINPQEEQNTIQYLGTGTLVWTIFNMLFAISIGSYIAGRMAQYDGLLHGLLMFGTSTIITLWLTMSLANGLITCAFNIIKPNINPIDNHHTISNVLPSIDNLVPGKKQNNSLNLDNLQNTLQNMLQQTNIIELQSEKFQSNTNIGPVYNTTQNPIEDNIKNVRDIDKDINDWIKNVINRNSNHLAAIDCDKLRNIIKLHTNKNFQEIEKIIKQTKQNYQKAVQIMYEENKQKTRKLTDSITAATTKASWFVFFILLIEAIFSAIFGHIGRRNQHNNYVLNNQSQ